MRRRVTRHERRRPDDESVPRRSPSMGSSSKQTVRRQREIQQQVDEQDKAAKAKKTAKKAKSGGNGEKKPPVQAGTRTQPENPMPAQHIAKPGNEHELDLAPRYLAPDYAGSGKLDGMATIVTGGDSGIGRSVAVLFAREGADVAVVYLSEHADAEETRRAVEDEGRRCLLIPGDVKDAKFCEQAVAQAVEEFGRLDV